MRSDFHTVSLSHPLYPLPSLPLSISFLIKPTSILTLGQTPLLSQKPFVADWDVSPFSFFYINLWFTAVFGSGGIFMWHSHPGLSTLPFPQDNCRVEKWGAWTKSCIVNFGFLFFLLGVFSLDHICLGYHQQDKQLFDIQEKFVFYIQIQHISPLTFKKETVACLCVFRTMQTVLVGIKMRNRASDTVKNVLLYKIDGWCVTFSSKTHVNISLHFFLKYSRHHSSTSLTFFFPC